MRRSRNQIKLEWTGKGEMPTWVTAFNIAGEQFDTLTAAVLALTAQVHESTATITTKLDNIEAAIRDGK